VPVRGGLGFIVAECHINYSSPVYFDEATRSRPRRLEAAAG
jgi:acyl-CoA thioesterase FadM